jgi:hypothetical protein
MVTVTVDNLGPTVAVTTPVDGATVAGTAVAFVADATDVVGVDRVEFFAAGTTLGVDTDGGDGWAVTWDTTLFPDGPVELTATATDISGFTDSAAVTVTVDNTGLGNALFVVGNPSTLSAGDTEVALRLEGLGFTVTLVDDHDVTPGATAGASFVLLSSTISSGVVGTTFYDVAEPVWVAKPWTLDDMGMTGPASGVDFGTSPGSIITIDNPAHPLAAGLDGDVTITSSNKTVSWGVPGGDGTVVATLDALPTIFVYDAGALLADGTTAAGCRLAFSLYRSAPTSFTDEAWTLFDAAALHAASGCS